MAHYTVTTATDTSIPDDGLISLREAITLANASAANDEIIFASSIFLNGVSTIVP
jgi:CSLREA domain-containing protein